MHLWYGRCCTNPGHNENEMDEMFLLSGGVLRMRGHLDGSGLG